MVKCSRIKTNYMEDSKFNTIFRNKQYLVYPGFVISKTDKDKHYIDFKELCRLYRVHHSLCINYNNLMLVDKQRVQNLGLIELRPDYHGNYIINRNRS